MTIICYDTEFLEDGKTIDLISIGLIASDGAAYYAVNNDCAIHRIRQDDWLWEHVCQQLPITYGDAEEFENRRQYAMLDTQAACVKPKWVIANEVRDFIREYSDPELWAYYGAYDHVALAQLWGKMIDLPSGVPMFTNEIMQLVNNTPGYKLPKSPKDEHNALVDAMWNMLVVKGALGTVA